MPVKPTIGTARAVGTDAGNRSMRKAGRTVWNADDYVAAVQAMDEIVGLIEPETAKPAT